MLIGCGFHAEEQAQTRIRISAAAAKTTGWPVEVRCGIFESEEEFPVFGGGC
jgi:hypothetical protein